MSKLGDKLRAVAAEVDAALSEDFEQKVADARAAIAAGKSARDLWNDGYTDEQLTAALDRDKYPGFYKDGRYQPPAGSIREEAAKRGVTVDELVGRVLHGDWDGLLLGAGGDEDRMLRGLVHQYAYAKARDSLASIGWTYAEVADLISKQLREAAE